MWTLEPLTAVIITGFAVAGLIQFMNWAHRVVLRLAGKIGSRFFVTRPDAQFIERGGK